MASIYESSCSPTLKSLLSCTICSNCFVDPVAITPCGHVFCQKCIAAVIEQGISIPRKNCFSKSKLRSSKMMKRKNCCPLCLGPAFLWTFSRVYLLERLLLLYSEHTAKLQSEENEPLSPYLELQSNNFFAGDVSEVPLGQLQWTAELSKRNATSEIALEKDIVASPNRNKENSLTYTNPSHNTCGPHTEKKNFVRWDSRASPLTSPLDRVSKEGVFKLDDVHTNDGLLRAKLPLLLELTSIIEEEDRILFRLRQKLCFLAEKLEGINLSPAQ
ncbi:tripartite motif-containing 64-like protein [Perkinsela sp. CCAP 1560/4]|nr:tripartite motif-containing 64-like protein [Perkinsela sp. CCAP 1560/4]|eukprot:KNH09782.1 tripartite motif-containing 64-like protein [Perkinsela sp. CCAP 1560/4]